MTAEGIALAVALAIVAAVVVFALSRPAGATRPGGALSRAVREDTLAWRGLVEQEAGLPGLWDYLVLALIAKESGGNENAIGSADPPERGLMQITEAAWEDYQRATNDPDTPTYEDAWPARTNIRVGAWFLSQKIEEMGTTREGLRAYNCGTAGAKRNPNCGAEYARTILEIFEPELRRSVT
jgi:soluble lytic murein transglycosylase-like protein